jgi:hypothetical protein
VNLFKPWCIIVTVCASFGKRMELLYHMELPIPREIVTSLLKFSIE